MTGVGVALTAPVAAHSSTREGEVRFALCWDQPEIRFAGGAKTWRRWYTR